MSTEENESLLKEVGEKLGKKAKFAVAVSAVVYLLLGYLVALFYNTSVDYTIYMCGFSMFAGIFMGYFVQNDLEEKSKVLLLQHNLFQKVLKQDSRVTAVTQEAEAKESIVPKKPRSKTKNSTVQSQEPPKQQAKSRSRSTAKKEILN